MKAIKKDQKKGNIKDFLISFPGKNPRKKLDIRKYISKSKNPDKKVNYSENLKSILYLDK